MHVSLRLGKLSTYLVNTAYVTSLTKTYHYNRPNEEADGRLRRVLGDGLAAEGGEDRHGYQTQGGRRTYRRY